MEDHLQNHYDRSFPGCMKSLTHFLDLHHHLHLRKMKMLTYKKHGVGKRASRTKKPKTDPDAPSTSQQCVSNEDENVVVEDDTRKQSIKTSIRMSIIPKWPLRDHNNKNRKVSTPPSKLLRTSSIHHMNAPPGHNVRPDLESSVIEQKAEDNNASFLNERAYMLHNTADEHNLEKQCAENMTCSQSNDNELEGLLHKVASFAQKDTNVEELQGDVMMHPSKEFLEMMKLFNGNIKLIQKILEDPSFIFSHYLQGQRATTAPLTRIYSFPAPGKIERSNAGLFSIEHKRFERISLVKQSGNYHSDNSLSHSDIVENDAPKTDIMVDDSVAPSSILQERRKNPSNSGHFKIIKQRIRDIIKDNKNEHHNHISMDGILHKIPYGKKMPKDMKKIKTSPFKKEMKKIKTSQLDGSVGEKSVGEGSRIKCGKHVAKNIKRSQSLNASLHRYSHLFESISKGAVNGLPEGPKLAKETAKTLGRMLSVSDIKYSSSSNDVQIEDQLRPSSPTNLITQRIEEFPGKEPEEFTTEVVSKSVPIDCEKSPLLSNEQDLSKRITSDIFIREDGNAIPTLDQELIDLEYRYELTKPTLHDTSLGFHDHAISKGSELEYPTDYGLECDKIDLKRPKSSSDTNSFDLLHLQIDGKDEAEFNYVREILKRSGFIGHDFVGSWHTPYQPMDPLIFFTEGEDLDYEPDIRDDEHHQLLFDMINEALVEIYETSFGYYFPWLSHFSTSIRPVPIGNHVLEEVWANIYWHLKGQSCLNNTFYGIVARDFTRNDGWMNTQSDIEDVELELECLILDDLLDEVAVQLSDFAGFTSNPR
ncbi:hypothetical protein KSP40_PGU015869 [Platanthera guangdongensis]|uniref:DUF4378 domain-containing protein n=1 Tax=Platanthera guangdongensis TaxID=2320717 RepID=A0ABR2M029_9ASPA